MDILGTGAGEGFALHFYHNSNVGRTGIALADPPTSGTPSDHRLEGAPEGVGGRGGGEESGVNLVADRSRNRVFRDCNSFLVPTETVALPGNIFWGLYVPGKYGKRVHIPFATRQKKHKPKKTTTIQ